MIPNLAYCARKYKIAMFGTSGHENFYDIVVDNSHVEVNGDGQGYGK
jgi:hypothetical protein